MGETCETCGYELPEHDPLCGEDLDMMEGIEVPVNFPISVEFDEDCGGYLVRYKHREHYTDDGDACQDIIDLASDHHKQQQRIAELEAALRELVKELGLDAAKACCSCFVFYDTKGNPDYQRTELCNAHHDQFGKWLQGDNKAGDSTNG